MFYVECHEISICPCCHHKLKVCGSRRRILYKSDASKVWLVIRRLQCIACQRVHHELPDVIVPYKRYEAEAIEAILLGDKNELPDYPCEASTAIRIKIWFFLLKDYFEGSIRAISQLYHSISFLQLPLLPLEKQSAGWLKSLVRILVNAGRWPQTRFA